MLNNLRAFLGVKPRDPLADYLDDHTLIIEIPKDEYRARSILQNARAQGIDRLFVVAGACAGMAHIARAEHGSEPPRDGHFEDESVLLLTITEEAGNNLVDLAASQPGLVAFDRASGRLRRAVLDLSHYQPWIQ